MEAEGLNLEFRIFLPLICLTSATSSESSNYGRAVKDVEDMFASVSSKQSKDGADNIRMAYVVGCNHWGAKYRGEKRKLEVKYRSHTFSLGGARDCVEAYKKKDYGKKGVQEMANKILEKLHKHCSYEHTDELAAVSARAIEANTICSMIKWRKHVVFQDQSDGGTSYAQVEYAYLEVDPMYNEDRGDGDAPRGERSSPDTATIKKWISIAVEGHYESIQRCIKTSFGCIYEAIKAGYDAKVPVLIAGYPTFVANQDLHAIAIQAGIEDTGSEKSSWWMADWRYRDMRYSERIAYQRQQVALFLQYIDVERVAAHKVVKVMSGRSIEQPSDQFST